jgi:hypothetical protein
MVATVSEFLTVGSSHTRIPNSQRLLLAPNFTYLQRRTRGQEGADRGYQLPGVSQGECGTRGRQAVPLHLAQLDQQIKGTLAAIGDLTDRTQVSRIYEPRQC